MKKILFSTLALVFLASCATQSSNRSPEENQAKLEQLKKSPSTWNDAPAEIFSNFTHFEFIQPKLSASLQVDEKKVASAQEANQVISNRLNPIFSKWQQQSHGDRTLLIESTYSQYKIVSSGARFFAGAFAGDSNVQIDVTMKDKTTGQIIASPFFFQRANAIGGAWSIGSHDKSIPGRLSVLLEKYLVDNYSALEGGPTGNDL